MTLDATEFVDEARRSGGWKKRCGLHPVLSSLSDADRAVVEEILSRDALDVSSGAIARVLTRHGFDVSHNWVTSHRQQKCSCFRNGSDS